jgi:hypothetical protein
MSEFLAWVIVLGLAGAIGGIYVLYAQIEKQRRDISEIVIHGSKEILAHLQRLSGSSLEVPEAAVGVILERRRAQRRHPGIPLSRQLDKSEQRTCTGRRWEDFPATQYLRF